MNFNFKKSTLLKTLIFISIFTLGGCSAGSDTSGNTNSNFNPTDVIVPGQLAISLDESEVYASDNVTATVSLNNSKNVKNLLVKITSSDPQTLVVNDSSCTIIDSESHNSCMIHLKALHMGHVKLDAINEDYHIDQPMDLNIEDNLSPDITIPGKLTLSLDESSVYINDQVTATLTLNNSHNVKNLNVTLVPTNVEKIKVIDNNCTNLDSESHNSCTVHLAALDAGHVTLNAFSDSYNLATSLDTDIYQHASDVIVPGKLTISVESANLRARDVTTVTVSLINSQNVPTEDITLSSSDSSILNVDGIVCKVSSVQNVCTFKIQTLKAGNTELSAIANDYNLKVVSNNIVITPAAFFATNKGIYLNNTLLASYDSVNSANPIFANDENGNMYVAYNRQIKVLNANNQLQDIVTTDTDPDHACSDCRITTITIVKSVMYLTFYHWDDKDELSSLDIDLTKKNSANSIYTFNSNVNKLIYSPQLPDINVPKGLAITTQSDGVILLGLDDTGHLPDGKISKAFLHGSETLNLLSFITGNYGFNAKDIYYFNPNTAQFNTIDTTNVEGSFSDLVNLQGQIYLGTDAGKVYLFDQTNNKWKLMNSGSAVSSMNISNNKLYVATSSGTIYSLNSDGSVTDLGIGDGTNIFGFVIGS